MALHEGGFLGGEGPRAIGTVEPTPVVGDLPGNIQVNNQVVGLGVLLPVRPLERDIGAAGNSGKFSG